ncbi:acyl-CoA dehydrogenase family protein [Acuticoccus sp. I52.16.1]|uniref:acyl-CoA dehydrogenase family protein n=1 Tax=Acuticoccus sp. I52.16.1 TaxID=2928472 RepID=UPI001FD57FD8|nr:acyl-CoA dehydrogenase family protein [Acuticoccus sp. I52.16.1]UOM34787.1 acyl-CoA dehydrogenase family protein [Acuticoccus sp. I52.16.1]
MSAAPPPAAPPARSPDALLSEAGAAVAAADRLLGDVRARLETLVAPEGRIDRTLADEHQVLLHGFAWFATTVEAVRQITAWGGRLAAAGAFGPLEQKILLAAAGESLAQLAGGVWMSQGEIVRPRDFGLADDAVAATLAPAAALMADGTAAALAAEIGASAAEADAYGALGLEDETLEMMRGEFRRFADAKIAPHAHGWHLADELIPLPLIEEMAELGVFGLTIPEDFGGLGLGKLAMCVVTEELSRGYIGTGSLGTRSEIAGELIASAGTDAQKAHYLPKLASGEILPTAVFTEPNAGSDLASLKTRAVKDGEDYVVTGAKTWITHAARTDLMTMMVRTDPDQPGYRGLSMLLAEKPRGTDADPFPASGMTGGEIAVLGYRGMKEYELSFDGFRVPTGALLGGREGEGFKQLMATFEAARIQTAARAVGVAQNAMETAVRYAGEREQFGRPIGAFPRVASKIGKMVVDTMVARQLTYFAARQKDSGRRCDIEAGMAKLLGARTAWANADNALQIHGGNGFSLEYEISRILCDARILNIFEGAAEIQAQVVARGLIEGRN